MRAQRILTSCPRIRTPRRGKCKGERKSVESKESRRWSGERGKMSGEAVGAQG